LAGDDVYKMDYGEMLVAHVQAAADITVGCVDVPIAEASAFGVMGVDENGFIRSFAEKPAQPAPMPSNPARALCSMGIYIFNRDFLIEQLIADADRPSSSHDFGRDIIPRVIEKYRAFAYPFHNPATGDMHYWRDVGTIDAYWKANLELIGVTPELNLYDRNWPIWTYQEQLPPAKFVFDDDNRRGVAIDSMVSGGCIISGARVHHSLLFSSVTVDAYSLIEDSVILPNVIIGEHCIIRRAVIDKECIIPAGTQIGVNAEEDKRRFHISDEGIVLVTPEMLGQHVHYVR
jgi:glucose-1-phosphate adenylyltransferase